MKSLTALLLTLGFTLSLQAAETPAPPAKAGDKSPAAAPVPAKPKKLPFSRVATTVSDKGFTHTQKDGSVETYTVDEKTIVENGKAAAKWAEVKAGDTVSGSAIKTAENAFTVVHVTKFAAKAPEAKK